MFRPGFLTLCALAFADAASAETVRLKSGQQFDLKMSVIEAPHALGGRDSGNTVAPVLSGAEKPTVLSARDARSLCILHGERLYQNLRRDTGFRTITQQIIDLDAPLVSVNVELRTPTGSGISTGQLHAFDMRGIVKCQPFQ